MGTRQSSDPSLDRLGETWDVVRLGESQRGLHNGQRVFGAVIDLPQEEDTSSFFGRYPVVLERAPSGELADGALQGLVLAGAVLLLSAGMSCRVMLLTALSYPP